MKNLCDKMKKIIEQLNQATYYYDLGKPIISDKEWDDLYFQLQELEKETNIIYNNSPTQHIQFDVVSSLNKVKHDHLLLSLAKTKSVSDIVTFLGTQEGIAMAKMDGLTCSIRYEGGKLVSAETRGNGTVGENITHNIPFVKGVPAEIPIKEKFVVDGEVICSYEDFEDFSADYKNPRNFASGSIRLLDSQASSKRKLTFVAWDCIAGMEEYENLSTKLFNLNELGFNIVPYLILPENTYSKIEHANILIKTMAKDFSYPIDGIVFKYNDCNYYESLGATEHHFRGGLAFKFYDEEYETELLNIEYTMGKTGILTPVAVFKPVETDSNIITRASLHNLSIMKSILGERPFVGQKIKVFLANQIIPQISYAEKDDK